MTRRIAGAVTALLAVFALVGLAGCSSSNVDLKPAKAQEIVRTLVDPATTADSAAALINSSDPTVGAKMHGFAQGASRGGYTPDKFTVKSVEGEGNKAVAEVAVASPHTPAPVTMSYTFDKVDGTWKLSSASADALVGMGAAKSHH